MPAPFSAPAPSRPHVDVIERAHGELGLSYDEIAEAVGANASTLHRWRAGETVPSPIFRRRLTALAALTVATREHLRRAAEAGVAARAWWDEPAALPGLAGACPGAVLAAGQLERLAAVLAAPTPPDEASLPGPPSLGPDGRLAGRRL
jgi:hypothetical protein